jgi:HPt (histidine-containing phosphotransfer) domain-containing protein
MSSHHQIKLFDTNIIRFGDLNQCQRLISLFIARIQQPLSSLNQGLKNNKK